MTDAEMLRELQSSQKPWLKHNFSNHRPWHPLLGIVEEFGELAAASTESEKADAVGDVVIFAADYCTSMGWDLADVWEESMRCETAARVETAILINLGKLCHAHLKLTQGIRVGEDWPAEGRRALAHLLACLRAAFGPGVVLEAKRTWEHVVSKRDWVANPVSGS